MIKENKDGSKKDGRGGYCSCHAAVGADMGVNWRVNRGSCQMRVTLLLQSAGGPRSPVTSLSLGGQRSCQQSSNLSHKWPMMDLGGGWGGDSNNTVATRWSPLLFSAITDIRATSITQRTGRLAVETLLCVTNAAETTHRWNKVNCSAAQYQGGKHWSPSSAEAFHD